MTNEQLAVFIQQGGNDELIPLLWERVRKLFYIRSDEWYRFHTELCADRGISAWDIKQVSYSAFLKAIEAYKPENDLMFSSYFKYPLLNAIRELTGRKNVLNNAVRLDAPVYTDTGGNEVTGSDLLPDDESKVLFEQVEESDKAVIVRQAVESLPDVLCSIIRMRFFELLTLKQCGVVLGISLERVRQLENNALKKLRYNRELKQLADGYGYGSQQLYYNSLKAYMGTGITNVEIIAIKRADTMQGIVRRYNERIADTL